MSSHLPFGGDGQDVPDKIRDHGKVVTALSGTPQSKVIDNLTGADKVPSNEELGRRAKAPGFDPHAGREHGDVPEPMISTLVFIGTDEGGTFEDAVQKLVAEAEKLGLIYVTATVGPFDLDKHVGDVADIAEETMNFSQDDDDDEEPEDERF